MANRFAGQSGSEVLVELQETLADLYQYIMQNNLVRSSFPKEVAAISFSDGEDHEVTLTIWGDISGQPLGAIRAGGGRGFLWEESNLKDGKRCQ